MIGFENLMQVRMMEGAMIFVNKETDEIFFVLENQGPIFFEDDNVAIYFWEA